MLFYLWISKFAAKSYTVPVFCLTDFADSSIQHQGISDRTGEVRLFYRVTGLRLTEIWNQIVPPRPTDLVFFGHDLQMLVSRLSKGCWHLPFLPLCMCSD